MGSSMPPMERVRPRAPAKLLQSHLPFILMFCLCVNLTIASPQTVSPVIWLPSKQRVAYKYVETISTFAIVNPCPILKDKYPESMTDTVLDACNSEFQQHIVDPLSQWCPEKSVHKRAIFTLGIILFAIVAVGLGATGTTMSIKNNIDITTLQEQQASDRKFMDGLELQIGTNYEHTRNNTRVLNGVVRNMEVLQQDYDDLKAKLPDMIVSSASIISKFHLGGHYIQDAVRMWKQDKISPSIFPFLNVSLPCLKGFDCPLDYATPISCSFKNNQNLTVRMTTPIVNHEFQLMEANQMDILIRKGNDTTCRGRYEGPKKLILSRQLKCVVRMGSEIPETALPFITGTVKCLPGHPETNDFFKPIDCTPIEKDDHLPFLQVQPVNGKIYVYCSGSNYTMNNVTRACPKDAFILPPTNRVLINGQEVVAPEIQLKAIIRFDEDLDSVVQHHIPTGPNWHDLEQPDLSSFKPIEHETDTILNQQNATTTGVCFIAVVGIVMFIRWVVKRCRRRPVNRPTGNNRTGPFSV